MTERPGRRPLRQEDWTAGLRRWRNQPLEREPDVKRTRALWGAQLAIVVATLPAGIYLLVQNECLQLTYAISELRAKHRELAKEERRLVGEYAALESLNKVEDWAASQGLEPPRPGGVVVLRDAIRGPAGASEAVAVARVPGDPLTLND